jgi:hypothetical protein
MPRPSLAVPIARAQEELALLARMANRHGLVAGATGTGKTVTLRVLAEGFSRLGVPVFVADVKGDLSGLALPGDGSGPVGERVKKPAERDEAVRGSALFGHYEQEVDRESAYEKLRGRAAEAQESRPAPRGRGGWSAPRGAGETALDMAASVAKSAARAAGTQLGREIMRGVLGSLFGGGGRRR